MTQCDLLQYNHTIEILRHAILYQRAACLRLRPRLSRALLLCRGRRHGAALELAGSFINNLHTVAKPATVVVAVAIPNTSTIPMPITIAVITSIATVDYY